MVFIDTNYFLRFLLKDIRKEHQQAKEIFEEAALGKVKLFTSMVVFFEIYWVLSSFYGKNKKELTQILADILNMNFINFERKESLNMTLDVFQKHNFDLEDCYNLVFAKTEKASSFATFDKKLDKEFKKAGQWY